MNDTKVCGYYGKLPGNGDFVSRHLPPQFIEVWDRWLQDALSQSRALLGEGWPEAYLTEPIWRFALSREVCSDTAWAGVIMPSIDKVGRHFPLTIATAMPSSGKLAHVIANCSTWFDEIEDLALTTIKEDFQREAFDQAIDTLTPPVAAASGTDDADEPVLPTSDIACRYEMSSRDDVGLILNDWTLHLLHMVIGPHSLWWSDGSDRYGPTLLVSPGLPSPQRSAAMLDGEWHRHGWNTSNKDAMTDE